MTASTRTARRFDNPNPFQFTPEQYQSLANLGIFNGHHVELHDGEIVETTEPTPQPFRFTREQYHKLGELGIFNGHRVELLFGEIVEMSPVNWPHRVSIGLLSDSLRLVFATGCFVDVQQPLVIGGTEPEPDVAVIAGTRRAVPNHPTTAVLVVEVADSTLQTDLTYKAELYATANIADYWVLDVNNRELHIFREPQPLPAGLGATAYRKHTIHTVADRVSPLAAPNASILVSELLP